MNNQTILIVGAGGLLGSNLVLSLLDKGCNVVATDIDVALMKNKLITVGINIENERLNLCELNIASEFDVKEFFENLSWHIDGAVNTSYPRNKKYGQHFFDVTLESFNENLGLHLGSAFLFTQQCAAYFMRTKRPFSLVNISSIYGVIAPKFKIYHNTNMTTPVEYAAIKSAIIHLNKYVAAYVNNSSFRINCVSPGGIFDNQDESFIQAYTRETHGKGMLEVDSIIGTVLFFLSNESKYITAQNLTIDDGFSL